MMLIKFHAMNLPIDKIKYNFLKANLFVFHEFKIDKINLLPLLLLLLLLLFYDKMK